MHHGGPSPVTVIGAPACTAIPDRNNFIKISLLLFRNTPAGGALQPHQRWVQTMSAGLKRLFCPKSIAVVGGGTWCENLIRECQAIGFQGALWSVHPSRKSVAGVRTYPDIAALPGAPDACFIGVNRNATIDIVRDLRARQAGGAVCFANGFLEAATETDDANELQEKLLEAAGGMPLIGPNCYGFINYLDGALLWPDQHGGTAVACGVAIITQSSNIAINLTMQRRGLPVAFMVTAGNQAQIGFAEIGAALLADDRVTALGLHIEGVGDLGAFERLAETARQLGKQIVALKVGRSDQAQVGAMSHTASLAGSDAGSAALLRRFGVAGVETLPEFLEALKLLHVVGPLDSHSIASMSCSGGEASLMADACFGRSVQFPALNRQQKTGLRAALGPMVNLANPLDYNTRIWPDTKAMGAVFSAMMVPDLAIGLVILDFPRNDRCNAREWQNVIDAVVQVRAEKKVPMAIVASLAENMPEDIATRLVDLGVAPMCGLPETIRAIEIAAMADQRADVNKPLLMPLQPQNISMPGEAEAKAALAVFGLQIPLGAIAATPSQAAAVAAKLGFPVVLKGAEIAHKTEAGAVVVNLRSQAGVQTAARAMQTDGYLVEQMVTDGIGELLVGVVLDPAHGYVLSLAAGGVLTEIMQDCASLLIPASAEDINTALRSLRVFAMLDGYRGAAPANIDAIIQAVMAVQAYVQAHHGYIQDVEINPLICRQNDAIAADALIRTGEPE